MLAALEPVVKEAARLLRATLPARIDETLRSQATDAGMRELILKATSVEEFCAAVRRMAQSIDPRAVATSAGPGH